MTEENVPVFQTPEYKTIQLVLEVRDLPENGNIWQKFLLATEEPLAALSNLVRYYDEPLVIASPLGVQVIREMGRTQNPILVYMNRENVQVIMDLETWQEVVMHSQMGRGSMLLASMWLAETINGLYTQHGKTALMCFGFESEGLEEPAPAAQD